MTSEPTTHGPGSEAKIDVLAARYADGHPLWHPGDARTPVKHHLDGKYSQRDIVHTLALDDLRRRGD